MQTIQEGGLPRSIRIWFCLIEEDLFLTKWIELLGCPEFH